MGSGVNVNTVDMSTQTSPLYDYLRLHHRALWGLWLVTQHFSHLPPAS